MLYQKRIATLCPKLMTPWISSVGQNTFQQWTSYQDTGKYQWRKRTSRKCAFITSEGLYQPTQMPQGLANAPATFQRLMGKKLRSLKYTFIIIFLDGIVYTKLFDNQLKGLRIVKLKVGMLTRLKMRIIIL